MNVLLIPVSLSTHTQGENTQYDTGDKEADWDSDVWCDWDEDCHGRIEDQGDEFPAGFTYTCCGEPGDAEGCRVGRHEEYVGHGRPYKRVRY